MPTANVQLLLDLTSARQKNPFSYKQVVGI